MSRKTGKSVGRHINQRVQKNEKVFLSLGVVKRKSKFRIQKIVQAFNFSDRHGAFFALPHLFVFVIKVNLFSQNRSTF